MKTTLSAAIVAAAAGTALASPITQDAGQHADNLANSQFALHLTGTAPTGIENTNGYMGIFSGSDTAATAEDQETFSLSTTTTYGVALDFTNATPQDSAITLSLNAMGGSAFSADVITNAFDGATVTALALDIQGLGTGSLTLDFNDGDGSTAFTNGFWLIEGFSNTFNIDGLLTTPGTINEGSPRITLYALSAAGSSGSGGNPIPTPAAAGMGLLGLGLVAARRRR